MKGVFTGTRGQLWGEGSRIKTCNARTRKGTLCQKPAEVHPSTGRRLRCRLHGGRGGSRTEETIASKDRHRYAPYDIDHWLSRKEVFVAHTAQAVDVLCSLGSST